MEENSEACQKGKYVAIGWNELGDLSWLNKEKDENTAKNKLVELYSKKNKSESKTQVSINSNQVYHFIKDIKNMDIVLSPTARRTILIGEITSDFFLAQKKDGCTYKQRRGINWMKEIPRDELSQPLRNSLNSHLTVFNVDNHKEELDAFIEGKKVANQPQKNYAQKDSEESIVGETINFRGLVYAPVNEQGVVFLFSKLSKDLNIELEEIKTGFPDAVGRVKTKKGYARRTIEFEFRSSNYDHLPNKSDIIVCWEHDWPECPQEIEVIALKDVVKELSK